MPPFVHINCAMSADGKIALPSREQTSISSREDFQRVHELRAKYDGILVGIGTVLEDDPGLTVKKEFVPEGKNPVRIVLDTNLRVPDEAKVLDHRARTILFCQDKIQTRIFPDNIEVRNCGSGAVDLEEALAVLEEMDISSILVEGGSKVIWSFLKQGLFDKLTIFVGSLIIGGAGSPTPAGGLGAGSLEETIPLKLESVKELGDGVLLEYSPVSIK